MKRLSYHIFLVILLVIAITALDKADAIVSDGEKANATNFNNSFMSREVDTDTIGNLTVKQNSELRLEDVAGGEYVSLKSPTSLLTSLNFILPGLDGSPTDILETDGSGNLSFVTKPTSFDYVAVGDGNIVTSSTTSGTQLFETSVNIDGSNNITGVNEFNLDSFFDMGEVTTPSNPATSRYRLYFKNTGSLYFLDEFGTETEFRSGLVDLTSQVTGVLPIANGGTNSSTALTNDLVMISTAGSIVESATTSTELSFLNNVTSDLQTQIDGKEPTLTKGDLTEATSSILTVTGGTGAVIGSGVTIEVQQASSLASGYLTSTDWTLFNGKQDTISGTANEIDVIANVVSIVDNPVFSGVESVTLPTGADGDRPVSPVNGMIRYNTTSSSFEGYQAGAWGELGGGGGVGGSRLQLISDPSFEEGVTEGSCTGCVATQDTTDKLGTDNNLASLKMAFSAASGNYTLTKSTSAQYSNVAGVVSAWIKTSASDCHFDELVNGTQSQTVAIGSSDEWKQYIINGTTGTTSYGWRVRCDTSITDDVFVDETFAGAAEPDTFDIGTASFYGSVKWVNTTNCQWASSSGTVADFAADVDCDDNARVIKGEYNSTNGDVGNSDGQKPQIKFSYLKSGKYRIVAKSYFYNGANTGCNYSFSDGTTNSVKQVFYAGTNDNGWSVIEGEFEYTTDQTTEKTFNIQVAQTAGAGGCNIFNSAQSAETEISVFHYPSPQKVVAASCSGLECVQSFSARFNTAGTLEDENVEWVQSVTKTSTGNYDITFKAGLFSEIPAYQVTSFESGSGGLSSYVRAISTSGMTVAFGQDGVAFADKSFSITLDRVGSDAKQFDSRFIPVVDDEIVIVRGEGNSGASITADVTDLDFTEIEDNNSLWSGTAFVPNVTGDYLISGSTNSTGSHAGTMQLFENGSLYKLIATNNITASIKTFSGAIRLIAGNSYTIRSSISMTLNNSTSNHWIQIHRLKDSKKAFIGNLTPKEFVQSTGASSPRLYSAHLTASTGAVSREVGNFINGSTCTYATGIYTCDISDANFSSTPNCWGIADDSNESFITQITAVSSTSVTIRIRDNGGSFALVNRNVNLFCHGVQ